MFPTLPKGETIAQFETYAEAQTAVDQLAKAEFPVKDLAVVGADLTSVERITGKLSWGRVALSGALSGAWFGIFLGLLFLIFAPTQPAVIIPAVILGAGFGLIFRLVTYAFNRRRRDFTSTMQVVATSYAIIGAPGNVARARDILGVGAPTIAPASHAAAPSEAGATNDAPESASTPVAPPADAISYGEAQDAARRARTNGATPRPRYGAMADDEPAEAPKNDKETSGE